MSIIGEVYEEYIEQDKITRRNKILSWGGLNNCKRNRRNGCKCCSDCPFIDLIEEAENYEKTRTSN